MHRPSLAGLFVPMCLLSLACSQVQRPTASLRSADVGAVTTDGFTANFALDVDNPNSFELPLTDADYALSLGGVQVTDGTVKPGGSIPGKGSTPVTIPVRLSFERLLKAEEAIRAGGGDVPYELDGALGFSGGSGLAALGIPTKIPLKYSGTLSLRKVFADPTVLLNSPAARRLAGKGLESLLNR
jgi:LEA14-like dessication related protein